MNYTVRGDHIVAELSGRIDALAAPILEKELERFAAEHAGITLEMDAQRLEYISSAGLRVLMKIRKRQGGLTVRGVSRDVYEIMDITGFTELLDVRRRPARYPRRAARCSEGAATERYTAWMKRLSSRSITRAHCRTRSKGKRNTPRRPSKKGFPAPSRMTRCGSETAMASCLSFSTRRLWEIHGHEQREHSEDV